MPILGQYYTLVAGLREMTAAAVGVVGGGGSDFGAIREEIMVALSAADRKTVELFYEWDRIAAVDDITQQREEFEAYYNKCAKSRDKFLREWSVFDRELRLEIVAGTVPQLAGKANIMDRERVLDNIRWEKADELSEFGTFGMDVIMAYLVKLGIVERWAKLDVVVGREMYDKLVRGLGVLA